MLDNGMHVVLIPNHKVPVVSHMVWYKVGAQDEVEGETGLAHLLEHLMFKATDTLASGEFSSRVAKAGGEDNAFTHYDYTGYFQNISKDKLEMVMEMEASRMQNLQLNEKELEIEKLVVLEERRTRTDNNPLALLAEKMNSDLFTSHSYARPIIGWQEDIKNLTLQDTQDFYTKYYSPNNAILIVVGDIDRNALESLAIKYYGTIPAKPLEKRSVIRTIEAKEPLNITYHDARVTQPHWLRFYVAPQQTNAECTECYALTLLSYLLGETRTSKLYESLVVEQKIASRISTYYNDLVLGPASFSISAIPSQNVSPERLEKAIDKELNDVITTPFSDEQLERAKNSLDAQIIYSQESFATLGQIFGNVYSLGLDGAYVTNWQHKIRAVTKEDIQKAASSLLQKNHSITGILLPQEEAKHAP
jgi:zinc protease